MMTKSLSVVAVVLVVLVLGSPVFAQTYAPVDFGGWRQSEEIYRMGTFGQQLGIPYAPVAAPSYGPANYPGYAPAPVQQQPLAPVSRQPDMWVYHEHHHQMEKQYAPTYTAPAPTYYRTGTNYCVPTSTYYCYPARTYYYQPSCLNSLFGF
jgi:hypothetical protein